MLIKCPQKKEKYVPLGPINTQKIVKNIEKIQLGAVRAGRALFCGGVIAGSSVMQNIAKNRSNNAEKIAKNLFKTVGH